MGACTFFGHHDCPADVKQKLQVVLIELIKNQSVNMFYVGNQGTYDRMVRSILRELKTVYPCINYAVVLAYMPQKRNEFDDWDFSDAMLPEGIETVPKQYAISWRNKWMLRQSDFVVVYIRHSWGGASQFAKMAERQKKTIVRL